MAEDLKIIESSDKGDQYKSLLPQIEALIMGENDLIANLGNISAALKEQFKWLWVGFYLIKDSQLVLGPFQGPVACTRIQKGKGVCGAAWEKSETMIVPDVEAFPGHIACSSASRSEIVLPLYLAGQIVGVLDVDSEHLSHFDNIDQFYLTEILKLVDA